MGTVMDRLRKHYADINAHNPAGPEFWVQPDRVETVLALYADTSGIDPDALLADKAAIWLLVAEGLGDAPADWPQSLVDLVQYHPDRTRDAQPVVDMMPMYVQRDVSRLVGTLLKAKRPVLLVAGPDDKIDPRVATLVQVRWTCRVDPNMVAGVRAHVWPGCPYAPPPDDWKRLDLTEVLVAARSAKDAADFTAILALTLEGNDDAKDPPPADPNDLVLAALGGPTERQVPKLSEMSGFGEARDWGLRLAADVRAYRDGVISWDDVDRGVLLSGPPGCGKTTFARALAAECGLRLFASGYSDWEGGSYVVKNMRTRFKEWLKAAETAPVIVLLDELDSLGRRGGNAQNESWWAAIINALLDFLDGATPRTGIVVIGATNYPDRIDPALMRPGRLDRHVAIPLPDVAALQGIVAHHLGVAADDPGLRTAARAVRGRSPADVQQLARDARRTARRAGRAATCGDLLEVLPARKWTPEEERAVAVHEAGHAVVGMAVGHRVLAVDLDGCETRFAGGEVILQATLRARMVSTLGARAAERLLLPDGTVGCTDDLARTTQAARELLFQMGAAGPTWVHPRAGLSDMQRDLLDGCLRTVEREAALHVEAGRSLVDRLAKRLVRDRYLDGDEVLAVVKSDRLATIFWGQADRDWERRQAAAEAMMDAEPAWRMAA